MFHDETAMGGNKNTEWYRTGKSVNMGFQRWALHQRQEFARASAEEGGGETETVAGGILVDLGAVEEHHDGWQLQQWSWRCMLAVAKVHVHALGVGLLVELQVHTRVSGSSRSGR